MSIKARGWCKGHSLRFYRHGDPLASAPRKTIAERFFAKVEVTESCWLWTGWTSVHGYGLMNINHRQERAHRVALEIVGRPCPEGLVVDHLCRVRNCVNPDHLEPVTAVENTMRGETIGAFNAAKTHCPQGHLYDESNTLHNPNGARVCRSCVIARGRARRARNGNVAA